MILQYFRNSSCKLTLQIVRLSQSLSAYCYLKIPKLLQCHRQPEAFRKIFVPSVNDHPAIVNIIPQILWKRPLYPDYFFSCDYAATEDSKWEDPFVYLIEQINIIEDAVKHCEGLKAWKAWKWLKSFPATNEMFKGNNRNTRTRWEIRSNLTMETPERRRCISHRNLRSSRPKVFSKKGVPKHFAKFTGKHLCQSLFFNIEALAQVFPVNLVKSLNDCFQNLPFGLLCQLTASHFDFNQT